MRPRRWLSVGAIPLVLALGIPGWAESPHLTQALKHARIAFNEGKNGYPEDLVLEAEEALRHAEAARKEAGSPALEDGIRMLKSAIAQGKQGQAVQATGAAEEALRHLDAAAQSSGGSPKGQ